MASDDLSVPRLVVIEPPEQAGLVLPLSAPQLVIGHSGSADLVLQDRFVSRRHALVTADPAGAVTITDLNSTGGTFVNGERLTGPRTLAPGDRVQFADLVARFEPAASQPAAAASLATQPDSLATQQLAAPAGAPAAETSPVTAQAGSAEGAAGSPGSGDSAGPAAGAEPIATDPGGTGYTVTGTAASPSLPGVLGLTVSLVDKNVGGDQVLATTQTGSDGSYAFTDLAISPKYLAAHYKTQPDLQVQVFAGGTLVATSAVRYSAPATVTLDVVLPATAAGLPSEYETLTANLGAAYPGSLAGLQEGNGRSDITYLANKTGWDARAIALAALAEQFSQITAPAPAPAADTAQTLVWPVPTAGLRPEYYYALFRAGLPANADGLFQASPQAARAIWEQAVSSGVIPQDLAKDVPDATARFQVLSASHLLTAAPPTGLSTMQQMIAPTLPGPAQQEQFARLYAQYQGNWDSFWPAVEQTLGTAAATQLQLSGQLYYLTVNNQPLVAALTAAEASNPLGSVQDLASRGYYDPAKWTPLIGSAVPPTIPGAGPDEQAANYAQLLAAQVRIAYPTAVLADQVRQSILPIAAAADIADGVAQFLADSAGQFEIGVEPVEAYLARTGVTGTPPAVVTQVKRLQRVYQLTQDDTSMAVLLQHNLDSAYAITRYDTAGFVSAFSDQLGSPDTATAIHVRAKQIFASVLSVAIGYLGGRIAPVVGGRVPVQYGYPPQSAPAGYPVTAYPTLEDLFGSLDYCDCSDCNSILSPAAYLVDLLNYIDQPAPAGGLSNPQDVLLQRRPDLQYLPLTCANTNTALPYIDIVNETLEYFVANGLSLAGYQGHDTPDTVTSAELIASPQYVDDDAYAIVQGSFFPPPLPFNRPLTLLRQQLSSLGVALPAAMAALRSGDQLVNRQTPTSYGWSDILLEQLAISRDEYRLFTDSSLQVGDLYGLPDGTALGTLQTTSLQEFSRRLGVSYDDLTAIIQTQFMNPSASLIPRLEQLNAPFSTLQALHDTLNTPQSIAADFISALPAGLDATQYGGISPADYQAVVNWVTSPQVYPLIMDIITISSPAGQADDCSGAALQLRYANPDSTANLLSGTDLLKLIRFIRLWRKLAPLLGDADDKVTIGQTDAIIAALYPAADIPVDPSSAASDAANRALLDSGFQTLLLRAGFLFQMMSLLSVTADRALGQLLACWASVGTAGPGSLYQAMFLSPTLLQQDPGAPTATVASTVNVGDVLHTMINGTEEIAAYTVLAADTAVSVAAAIVARINASTTPDPVSGVPLNSRFAATSEGGVVTIKAGFTLACSVSAGASETYTPGTMSPAAASATVAGTVTAGDTLTTSIDGVPAGYTVLASDTAVTIAAGIAAAVNATTIADPFSGLPLSALVAASSAGPVVTFVAANAGAPFTLACSLDPAAAGTYTATGPVAGAATATVAGTIPAGAILTTTINALPVAYQAAPGDTPATIAAAIAAAIAATTTADLATGLPLNSLLTASAAGGVITLTAASPTTPFTLAASLTGGGYTAGRRTPPFADDGYGDFLADPTQTMFGHEGTLCAAGNLTGAEFSLITAALGFDASTPLTLANLSALLRYGWLAHTLGLSVLEFLLLRTCTGLDPFAPLDLGATPPVQPPAIRFANLLSALAAAGLSTVAALYLMWNRDISGNSGPAVTDVTGLAAALVAGFAAVEAEFSIQDDPDGSIAEGLMTLVYGAAASDFFFGLLNGTVTESVSYSTPPGQQTLPQPVIDASAGRLSYDDLAKQLTFAGVLDAATVTAIDGAITADPALVAAVASLAAASQQATAPFFATYPELAPLYAAYVASADPVQARRAALLDSFLPILKLKRKEEQALASVTAAAGTDPAFATALLQNPAILHADADATAAAVTDLTAIADQGLTARFYLGDNLASPADLTIDSVPALRYAQTATIGGTITAGDVLTITISGVPVSYAAGSAAAATPPLGPADSSLAALAGNIAAAINATTSPDPVSTLPLNQVVSAAASGSVITLNGLDPSGARSFFTLACAVSAGGTETCTAGRQLPAGGGPIAGVWSGYLTVPQDGLYDINVATDPGAAVTVQVGGGAVPGEQAGGLWTNQGQVSLVAGQLVPVTLTVTSVRTTLSVSWRSLGTGWQVIPSQYLYPASLVARLENTYVRFLKATTLATALSLTAAEISYLGATPGAAVNTTDATSVPAGPAVFTPASMAGIAVGSVLVVDTGSAQESVTVTATTAATFSAVAANSHDGTAAPFPIVSQASPVIGAGWLNFLSAQGSQDPATAASLGLVLGSLLDFARIKHALSPTDERLLTVLQDPAATLPNGQSALLSLTGWSQASVNALRTQFFGSTDPASLSSVPNFSRVLDAYSLVTSCGLTASALISAITNAPTPQTVSALQSALRAQYSETDWLTVIGPINDTARIKQRDALVAYILQQLGDRYADSVISEATSAAAATGVTQLSLADTSGISAGMLVQGTGIAPGSVVTAVAAGTVTVSQPVLAALPAGAGLEFAPAGAVSVDTADSLFEYLLVDTQTQPPVLTSRIRLALSAVQLFIERVVRNLEPAVSPADIDAAQWEWMKRYRVWQANREVFLWPENWLYPELRDNQSPFFQQMMSALLQGDITDDAATTAYLGYLTNLEEIAKLEPCGLYYLPGATGTDETSYVVARTAGAHRKYYFRQLTGGSWTPWTQVQVECEDLPITPIVWNGRLFLFWLKITKQAQPQPASLAETNTSVQNNEVASLHMSDLQNYSQAAVTAAGRGSVTVGAVLHWTEFYNGSWQPAKTSDVSHPTTIGFFDPAGAGSFEAVRSLVRIVPAQVTGTNIVTELLDAPFTLPPDALLLAISVAGQGPGPGGFILHNTHSLPVCLDDIVLPGHLFGPAMIPLYDVLDPPNPSRSFPAAQPYTGGYGTDTFAISYQDALGTPPLRISSVLDYSWQPRWVDVQPGLEDAWDAPFIYEDRRYQFYVTSTEHLVPIWRFNGFGILSVGAAATAAKLSVSPIVLRQSVTAATPAEVLAVSASGGDPVAVQRYLSQGSNISAALPGAVTVTYQGQVISPIGSLAALDPAAITNGNVRDAAVADGEGA